MKNSKTIPRDLLPKFRKTLEPEGNRKFLGHGNLQYFSCGRWALYYGLKSIPINKNDKVLVPSFICRELLASINALGAVPEFYPINKEMRISIDTSNLSKCKAIIAVNYFGFPQDLKPFEDYCKKNGSALIEDNAHGLFSRDESGNLLGFRGDMGVFSLRKTLPVINGGALSINNVMYKFSIEHLGSKKYRDLFFEIKRIIRKTRPAIGVKLMYNLTRLLRLLRKIKTGHEIVPSEEGLESEIPFPPEPSDDMFPTYTKLDITHEIKRRRNLYKVLHGLLKNCGAEPVFQELPEQTVPYGYPFYAGMPKMESIQKVLKKNSMECFSWPELPNEIKNQAPDFYNNLYLVWFS